MFTEDKNKYMHLAKWIIGIVSSCILIYLGIRYIHVVGNSIHWAIELILPIIIGIIMALILNIPLHFFEQYIFTQLIKVKSKTLKRNFSILLSIVCILSVFVLVLFLIVPELIQAISTLINIGTESIHTISNVTDKIDYSVIPFGNYLEKINIDWNSLASRLQELLPSYFETFASQVPAVIGSSFGIFINLFLGLIFSIYILAQKEKLKKQSVHMIQVWIPEKIGYMILHIVSVFADAFRNFIVGQTTEALILGTLCSVGMAILGLPYAPTIGVLVGVTAFIPYIGAYIGAIIGFIMILTINPLKALIFIIFLLILQQIEGNVIYPKVVGKRINLPSLWVLVALTVGGNLAGPIGMLLGVPAFSAAFVLINEATQKKTLKKGGTLND